MNELLVNVLLLLGSFSMLSGGIGLLRMPDVYARSSSVAKAVTLGLSLLLTAAALHFWDTAVTARALLVMLFLFLTSPVSAQMLTRAAYLTGAQLWRETFVNQLEDRYDLKSQTLASPDSVFHSDDKQNQNSSDTR